LFLSSLLLSAEHGDPIGRDGLGFVGMLIDPAEIPQILCGLEFTGNKWVFPFHNNNNNNNNKAFKSQIL